MPRRGSFALPDGKIPSVGAATIALVDAAFAEAATRPDPAVETDSVSTMLGPARAGLAGVTAHAWFDANPLPEGLSALPLVEPAVDHTIGFVVPIGIDRKPVVAELLALFEPYQLDRHLPA